jgi:hypothetical protein
MGYGHSLDLRKWIVEAVRSGNVALGAGIGAGVRLLGGFLYGQHQKGYID